jgi:integrase/recombinase XerD
LESYRSFFKWAGNELAIDRPNLTLKMPAWESREIIPFTEDEIKSLLKSCEYAIVPAGKRKAYQFRRANATRDKAIILTLLDTGIRVGELTRLRLGDVNLENGEVYIHPFHVKKSHSQTTYYGKIARKVLWHYIVNREGVRADEMLFVTSSNKPMTCHRVLNLLSRLGKSAAIRSVHPHRFRHTFAIQYIRNGGDIFTLTRLLGHKRLDMVNHYLNISSTDTQNAH